jgi:heat shock protein HslJ
MKFVKVFSILALSSMFITSCSSTSATNINIKKISIYNSDWKLINDDNILVRGFNRENVTLNINDNTFNVSGFAGCNNYTSTITTDNDKIKFGPIASTKIICPNYKIEDSFLDLLDDVNRYEIKGSELYLYKNNILLFKFIK